MAEWIFVLAVYANAYYPQFVDIQTIGPFVTLERCQEASRSVGDHFGSGVQIVMPCARR